MQKPGGRGWRLCIDYRLVNENTIPQVWPLKRIDDILENIGKCKVFTSLDLTRGYWHQSLTERAKTLSSFITQDGHYQFKYGTPQGLRDAPIVFQANMDHMFLGLDDVIAYLDDIVYASMSPTEHLHRLPAVLERVRQSKSKISLRKCKFMEKELLILGHFVGDGKVRISPAYKSKLLTIERPTSRKGLQKVLGIANWVGRFTPRLAPLTLPFSELLKGKLKWTPAIWTHKRINQFDKLKKCLEKAAQESMLCPDETKPFRLQTDASQNAIGATLLQLDENSEKWKPIAYLSRGPTVTQRR